MSDKFSLGVMMKLGSLCDGAGTCPLAARMCGREPVWASEIEAFPVEVTKKRFPNMKHLGDVTKIKGDEIEPVDIITFGSPCQDLSMAGARKGLDGERSGLFMEAVRIIKEMRKKTDGRYPRFAVWENVCGAFSSNNGDDFRVVLEELCRVKESSANVPRPDWGGNQMLNLFGEMQDPLWETTTPSHGGSLMHNFGESPKGGEESTLSQILEDNVPQKYSLSEIACQGVLRRKEKHGKALPPLLLIALLIHSGLPKAKIIEEIKKSPHLRTIQTTQELQKLEMSCTDSIADVVQGGATSR